MTPETMGMTPDQVQVWCYAVVLGLFAGLVLGWGFGRARGYEVALKDMTRAFRRIDG